MPLNGNGNSRLQPAQAYVRNGSWQAAARCTEHEQHFYVRTLQQCFRPGKRWLDAGCGHALLQDWIPKAKEIERRFLGEAGWIVGADVDTQSLSLPCSIPRVACDLEALVFEDATFDLITCNMVVEHLAEPQAVFGEFFRALKPEGVVVILTPNLCHWVNILARVTPFWFRSWAMKKLGERSPEGVFPTHYRCNTQTAVQRTLRSGGISPITVHMVPGRPRLVEFGPLSYPEYLFYRISLRFPQLRKVLCVVAQKRRVRSKAARPSSNLDLHKHESKLSTQVAS